MGGPGGCLPVHANIAKLGVCGAAELRVAIGRDIGELAGDGAVVNDGVALFRTYETAPS